jgi:hypothetical protein
LVLPQPLIPLFMTSRLFTPWVNARLLLIACLLSPAFDNTFAQSSSTDSDAAEEIIELSPFEVNASEQDGYLASSTLGGTRLNTRLEDVAASITVVTKEFMEDIGANDAGDLLTHTAGTEVSGTRGNFTGATSSSQGAPDDIDSIRDGGQQNRVRGLTSADVSRNYFQTSIPFDGYNTQQVEINRGSNAVLFGLGSPAGIINNVTQNAVFKNRGQARLMLDSLGRVRSELNINRVIIDDTLAVRLAGVWDDRKYEQEDAFNETERFYATARFNKDLIGKNDRTWGRTIINASVELGDNISNLPRTTPPQDLITPWFQPYTNSVLGTVNLTPKPEWDAQYSRLVGFPEAAAFEPRNPVDPNNATFGNPGLQLAKSNNWATSPALVYDSPTDTSPSHPTYGSNVVGAMGSLYGFPTGTFTDEIPRSRDYFAQSPFHTTVASLRQALGAWNGTVDNPLGDEDSSISDSAILWVTPVVTDRSLFDYRKQLLDGPDNKREGFDFDVVNFSLQQLFFDEKLGLEYAFASEKLERSWDGGIGTRNALHIDTNRYLLDGTENQNFGRPMFFSGSRSRSERVFEKETHRLTAFWDLDFRDRDGWARWLGRHVFTGLWSKYDQDSSGVFRAWGWSPELTEVYRAGNAWPEAWGDSNVVGVHYLGPSIAHLDTPAGANISNLRVSQNPATAGITGDDLLYIHPLSTTIEPNGWQTIPVPEYSLAPVDGFLSRSTYEARALVMQSYFLKDHLVSTVSWREDIVEDYNAQTPQRLPDDSGVDLTDFTTETTFENSKETFTYGVIGKLPEFTYDWTDGLISGLNVFYNESENFQPTGIRYNAYREVLPQPTGETRDYGFLVKLLNDKVNLKVTFYETNQLDTTMVGGAHWIPHFSQNMLLGWYNNMHRQIEQGWTREENGVGYLGALGYVEGTGHIRVDINRGKGDVEEVIVSPPPQYLLDWYGLSVDLSKEQNPYDRVPNGDWLHRYTVDLEAEGMELELVYNPTPNWRIAFNATRQEAVQTGGGAEFDDWLKNAPYFDTDIDGVPDMSIVDALTGPYKDVQFNWNETLENYLLDRWWLPWFSQITVDNGKATPELSKWSFNLIQNYDFRTGPLKGFSIGGSVRWRQKQGIGYGLKDDNPAELDFNKLIQGDDYLRLQMWFGYKHKFENGITWNVRLNIRNLLDDTDLIPIKANPDGTVAGYRIGEPRVFEIVNTIQF